jgi:tetratricopeptide (TPR) repeat protein
MQIPPARRSAALLLGLALASCSSHDTEFDPEKQLELYMTTATYLYQDGSLLRAQDQAVKALEIEPENRPMRRMIGWIRLRMGGTEDLLIAERFFEDLAADGDTDAPVLLGLATAEERLGTAHDEAARAILSGERYTESPDPEKRSAELASEAQRYFTEAHGHYEQVLSGSTQANKALNGLQRVAALQGNYEESLDWGRQLLEICKAESEGWKRALETRELSGTEEGVATESIRTVTDLEVETRLFSTSILHRLGRTGEALEHLRIAIELDPDRADLYSRRAQLQSEVGLYAEALSDLDRFLRYSTLDFEHPDVRKAYELRTFCEGRLAESALNAEAKTGS